MKNGYELFVRPLLFSLDAETAHHLTIGLLGRASHFDVALRALRSFQPTLETENASLVSTSQTQLDLRPGWTRTVLLFPRGQRSDSVLSRLGP